MTKEKSKINRPFFLIKKQQSRLNFQAALLLFDYFSMDLNGVTIELLCAKDKA
jgi:hypothetical protein